MTRMIEVIYDEECLCRELTICSLISNLPTLKNGIGRVVCGL